MDMRVAASEAEQREVVSMRSRRKEEETVGQTRSDFFSSET
jgi:hypothetical protein